MSQKGRNGRTWKILEVLLLSDFLPKDVSKLMASRGWLTVADVLMSVIEAEEIDNKPITDLDLPEYIEYRLIGRGYNTIGSLDTLTERKVLVFLSGLGRGAITKINQAREKYGKPPITRN